MLVDGIVGLEDFAALNAKAGGMLIALVKFRPNDNAKDELEEGQYDSKNTRFPKSVLKQIKRCAFLECRPYVGVAHGNTATLANSDVQCQHCWRHSSTVPDVLLNLLQKKLKVVCEFKTNFCKLLATFILLPELKLLLELS
jgi:hypothetical protein